MAINNEEYLFEPSDPVVRLGSEAQLGGQDPRKTQIPASEIHADIKGEIQMHRDQPVYSEKESVIPNEGIETDDPELKNPESGTTWIKAFRAGEHVDSDGKKHTWDLRDLKMIAQQYNKVSDPDNPNRKIAPVVLGHPESNDAPASGWIDKVKTVGKDLWLKLRDLQPEFVDAVKAKRYGPRSISLYPDLNIRHIGFLGAKQPAVPGLIPYSFASNEKYTTYNFGENMEDINAMKQELTNMREESKFWKFFTKVVGLGKSYEELSRDFKEANDGSAPGSIMSQDKPTVETIDQKFPAGATMAEPIKDKKTISKIDHAKYAKSYASKGMEALCPAPSPVAGESGVDISAKLEEFSRLAMMHHCYAKDDGSDDDADKEWKSDNCNYSKMFSSIIKHSDSLLPAPVAITSGNYSKKEDKKDETKAPELNINHSEEVKVSENKAIAELRAEMAALKDTLAKQISFNEELKSKAERTVVSEYAEFIDKLVGTGQIMPKDVDLHIKNMKLRADYDKAQASDFAEGKIENQPDSQLQEYKEYLESLPKTMIFEELLVGKTPAPIPPANFVEEEIKKVQEKNPDFKYHEALDIVRIKHPKETADYIRSGFENIAGPFVR